jgi:hypothetical protein
VALSFSMPSQPSWHARLHTILAQLRGLHAEYVDRQTVERIFGVGERRARQIMAGLSTIKVGNAAAVRRTSLLERLESDPASVSKSSRILNARPLNGHARPTRGQLPLGIHLAEGELRVSFISPPELAAKLSAAAAAIEADWDAFSAATRIVSPPAESARERRVQFEESLKQTLLSQGSADEGATIRREAVGKRERLGAPAVERPTRPDVADKDSSHRVSLKERYEEFCLAKVKDHLSSLPRAVRSQRFEETRSAIRRAAPQLRRNDLDEIAQRELESKIRLALNLPSIEEFAAGTA